MAALKVEQHRQRPFCSLSSFLLSSSCGLLSNQPGPWTHSHAQWTQTTWPIEHPTDCVISAPLNQKQTDGGHFAFSKRPGRVGARRRPARPPAPPPLAVCLAPLALPPSLIHSHVPSLSVCPDRTGQGLTAGEFLTLLFAFPRFSGNSRNLRRGENEDNLLNLLIPLNLSNPP